MKRLVILFLLLITFALSACGESEEQEIMFTNKQGSETTICSHEGCENLIAPSGDTLYCIEHS